MTTEIVGENGRASQEARILRAMEIGWVDPMFALKFFGCFRLGARIYDLKQSGYDIETRMVSKGGKRYAQYRLRKGAKA